MKKKIYSALIIGSFLQAACTAVVPLDAESKSDEVKLFKLPPANKSALYIYRENAFMKLFGAALKKSIYVDGKFIGESSPSVFFYVQVAPGKHTLSTESDIGTNELEISTEGGKNYFIRQRMTPGLGVAGANLQIKSEKEGKHVVKKLRLAKIQQFEH